MQIEKIVCYCADCGKDHTIDIEDVPCRVEYEDMERRLAESQRENDRLQEELDALKADVSSRADALGKTLARVACLDAHDLVEKPATLPA